jgi:hypothetical protein
MQRNILETWLAILMLLSCVAANTEKFTFQWGQARGNIHEKVDYVELKGMLTTPRSILRDMHFTFGKVDTFILKRLNTRKLWLDNVCVSAFGIGNVGNDWWELRVNYPATVRSIDI